MTGVDNATDVGRLLEGRVALVSGVGPGMGRDLSLRVVVPPSEDVANAIVFFASDLARWITGQALDVNGGEWFH